MADTDKSPETFSNNDILFDCPHCGKNLAIDYRGAGLTIRCPACQGELQVPIPKGVDIADIDRLGVVQVRGVEAEEPLPLPETPEQIQTVMTELEELRVRRRYLEHQRAKAVKGLQAIERQVALMRTALDQIEDTLKQLSEPSSEDTQDLA